MILQVVQYTYIAGDSTGMESSTIKTGSTLRKYRRCKSFTSFRFCYAWVKLFRIPLLQKSFSSGPISTSWVASQRFSWVCTSPLVYHFPHDHNMLWVNMATQLFQGNVLEDRKKWVISLQIQWLDPQMFGHDADACQVQIPASPAIGGANWTTYQNAIWGVYPPSLLAPQIDSHIPMNNFAKKTICCPKTVCCRRFYPVSCTEMLRISYQLHGWRCYQYPHGGFPQGSRPIPMLNLFGPSHMW
jgi:hypothetical protein